MKQWQRQEIRRLLNAKKEGEHYRVYLVNHFDFSDAAFSQPEVLLELMAAKLMAEINSKLSTCERIRSAATKKEYREGNVEPARVV